MLSLVLSFLVPFTGGNVDIFDARSGTWSTAVLSVRDFHAATSLPPYGLALFAAPSE
jgi:hypothetical protein